MNFIYVFVELKNFNIVDIF